MELIIYINLAVCNHLMRDDDIPARIICIFTQPCSSVPFTAGMVIHWCFSLKRRSIASQLTLPAVLFQC